MPSMILRQPADILRLSIKLQAPKMPITVSWVQGEDRTTQQNALLHMWFGQIAKHYGDRTMLDVKGVCHVKYGVPIRMREAVFAFVYKRALGDLSYEKQCDFFAQEKPPIHISSEMKLPELSEYMTAMAADYRAEGVYLTDPELRKYEAEQ